MDIQCAAAVVCVRPGDAWPTSAGGRRVSAGYARREPTAGTGDLAWFAYPDEPAPAEVVRAVADRHRGEAAVIVMSDEELSVLAVPSGTVLLVDSDGFVLADS